jgi:hypothetical protein
VGDEGREFPPLEATTTGEKPTNGEEGATLVGDCIIFFVGDSREALVEEGGRADVLFADRGVNGDGVLVIYHQMTGAMLEVSEMCARQLEHTVMIKLLTVKDRKERELGRFIRVWTGVVVVVMKVVKRECAEGGLCCCDVFVTRQSRWRCKQKGRPVTRSLLGSGSITMYHSRLFRAPIGLWPWRLLECTAI